VHEDRGVAEGRVVKRWPRSIHKGGVVKKIKTLEKELAVKVNRVAPGAFFIEYRSTERGGKVVTGPHVTVYVPVASYKAGVRIALRVLFDRLHSDISRSYLEPVTIYGGVSDHRYRPVVLVQREEA